MKTFLQKQTLMMVAMVILTTTVLPGFGWSIKDPSKASLRIALLPIPDALPFHVADIKGYFKYEGVTAKPIPVASPVERDQLMQTGQIDGMLTEITTTAYFNRSGVKIKIVSTARAPLAGYSLFRILAAPNSRLRSPEDLAGVPIGISKNTIIEYVTDRLLMEKGLGPKEIKKISIPIIPERYQLLLQGRIKAATLPEPLANSAMKAGAIQIVKDGDFPKYSVSVLAFSLKSLQSKPEAVRAFLRAWDRAAEDINTSPETQRNIMLKRIRVPGNIRATYSIPMFPRGEVPNAVQWADAMDWMLSKHLLDHILHYQDSITSEYLP
jgi:NitT/TauT family transport system substrate-binding protein